MTALDRLAEKPLDRAVRTQVDRHPGGCNGQSEDSASSPP